MNRFVLISGCSGGGKSTLLDELHRRGYAVVAEPGRRIVAEELAGARTALPWLDPAAFARRALALALDDLRLADARPGWVFFDRGLIDAAAALQHATDEPVLAVLGRTHRYHRRVFLTPPWPEIYVMDRERRHGIEAAESEYRRLLDVYPSLGYAVAVLPKLSVQARADFVLKTLDVTDSTGTNRSAAV